ncbi:MAG: PIN domain-containing protein [Acidobacteriota bacterium]|nr:MAG: PIN domain-containing protein [Acidobacteriota bacterium]
MFLIDTSVWVSVFRKPELGERLRTRVGDGSYVLTRFNQLELLQGSADVTEWERLEEYLESQVYLECQNSTWKTAARLYFDLRREGKTVRSPIDCCIAQLAIEHDVVLLHRDRDFDTIATIRPLLRAEWFGTEYQANGLTG